MIRFKSIISRIVILHVIAVAITSVLMSVALSWLLSVATNNIHNEAMEEQAVSLAEHLVQEADGRLSLHLPPNLQGLYSQPYGRYSYAVVDDAGRTLFSSLKGNAPVFAADPRAATVQFLDAHIGGAAISGASVRRIIGGKTVWVQAAEDLANNDVLIDDIVDDFYRHVGWITLPILLLLLAIDIAISRARCCRCGRPTETARRLAPARTDIRLPLPGSTRARSGRWSPRSTRRSIASIKVSACSVNSPRRRPRAAHAAFHPADPRRTLDDRRRESAA